MIIPRYWAESTERVEMQGRRFTVKRFGWSNTDQQDAQKNAEERTLKAIIELKERGTVRLVDHKVAYNGAEGLPIREEVVEEIGETVLTRNSYGAICLNTPNVLFADIDLEPRLHPIVHLLTLLICIGVGIGVWITWKTITGFLIFLAYPLLASGIQAIWNSTRGGSASIAMGKVQRFSARNPHLNLQIYRTPNGYRVLCLSHTFDPRAESTRNALQEMGSDPAYVRMCQNQSCFRARVSPKPWRIGMSRIQPNHGIWPIAKDKLPRRKKWIADYEPASAKFSSAHFLNQLGATSKTRDAEAVQKLHDRLCQANRTDLPLA